MRTYLHYWFFSKKQLFVLLSSWIVLFISVLLISILSLIISYSLTPFRCDFSFFPLELSGVLWSLLVWDLSLKFFSFVFFCFIYVDSTMSLLLWTAFIVSRMFRYVMYSFFSSYRTSLISFLFYLKPFFSFRRMNQYVI